MTGFSNLFKILVKPRFKRLNGWLLVEVAAIAILVLINGLQTGFGQPEVIGIPVGVAAISMFVAFIILTIGHEKIYTQDVYRLIPTTDTKLYLSNLLSSLVLYFYVAVVQLVIILLDFIFNHQVLISMYQSIHTEGGFGMNHARLLAMTLFMMTFCVCGWTSISLAHLIMRFAQNFLPNISQKVVRVVINIILIVAAFYLFSLILNGVAGIENLVPAKDFTIQFLTSTVSLWVVIVLESLGSIYLLRHWVETVA